MLADLEKNASRVHLNSVGSKAALFKVLPRYKLRQEGDKVILGDKVFFMSPKVMLFQSASSSCRLLDISLIDSPM